MILYIKIFISVLLWKASAAYEGKYAECPSSDFRLEVIVGLQGVINEDRIEFVDSTPDLEYATICAWSTTNGKRIIPGTLWSYFVDGQVDSMLVEGISEDGISSVRIGVNGETKIVSKNFKANTEYYVCLQYFVPDNKVEVYIDGDKEKTINFQDLGEKILGGGKLTLGQRQECKEGCFNHKRAYDGRIRNMMTWERLLSVAEMKQIVASNTCPVDTVLDSGRSRIIDRTKRKCVQTSHTFNNTGNRTQFIEVLGSLPELEYVTVCVVLPPSSIPTAIPKTILSYTLGNRTILSIGGEATDQGPMFRYELNGEVHYSQGIFLNSQKYPVCFLLDFKQKLITTFLTIWGIGRVNFKSMNALPAGGKLVVGQLQRCERGCFDKSQGYNGKIENFHLWGRILHLYGVVNFNKGFCTNDALVRLNEDEIQFHDHVVEHKVGLTQ